MSFWEPLGFSAGREPAAEAQAIVNIKSEITFLRSGAPPRPISPFPSSLSLARDYAWGKGILPPHLEGPFLAPERIGAHNPSLRVDPTVEYAARLMELSRGFVGCIAGKGASVSLATRIRLWRTFRRQLRRAPPVSRMCRTPPGFRECRSFDKSDQTRRKPALPHSQFLCENSALQFPHVSSAQFRERS